MTTLWFGFAVDVPTMAGGGVLCGNGTPSVLAFCRAYCDLSKGGRLFCKVGPVARRTITHFVFSILFAPVRAEWFGKSLKSTLNAKFRVLARRIMGSPNASTSSIALQRRWSVVSSVISRYRGIALGVFLVKVEAAVFLQYSSMPVASRPWLVGELMRGGVKISLRRA